jgi:autotransporter-associated beta strand protein/predicted outer membrane repeat protein
MPQTRVAQGPRPAGARPPTRPRRLTAVLLVAALGLTGPRPGRAQTTPITITLISPPTAVTDASTNLQLAIRNFAAGTGTAAAVETAQDNYNDAVMTAAGVPPPDGNLIGAPSTVSSSVSVPPGQAAVIFATDSGSLVFDGVRMTNSGGFFLGPGAVALSTVGVVNPMAQLPFSFTRNTTTTSYGGAIFNLSPATATIANSSFSGNSATYGGAISNLSLSAEAAPTATIINSSFTGNTALSGGAIFNSGGTATIINSSFTGNIASVSSGAILISGGTATIANSSFMNNSALGFGGAILISGTAAITNGSFSGNSSTFEGGAINNSGTATIANSNFNRNSAIVGTGGAIYNSGTINLNVGAGQTSTFSGNTAAGSPSSIFFSGGILNLSLAGGGLLDMRDPMSGSFSPATISETGSGVWALGGGNVFTLVSNTFSVNGGTLYLYAAGEVPNPTTSTPAAQVAAGTIALSGAGSSFALGPGATLVAAGNNSITVNGPITLANGAAIRGGTAADAGFLPHDLSLPSGGIDSSLTLAPAAGTVGLGGQLTAQAVVAADTFTLNANLANASGSTSSLLVPGMGTVILTGANTYTGATTINGGTLLGGAANTFSAMSPTTINTGGTLDLGGLAQTINAVTLAGGTIQNGPLVGLITSQGGTVNGIGGTAALTTTAGTTRVIG